jgi:hypothetical protein
VCVRDWLARKDLPPQQKGVPRQRKLDKEALRAQVRDYPDRLIRERAAHLGVYPHAISVALKALQLTRKKDAQVPGARSGKMANLRAGTARDYCRAWGAGHRV